MDNKKALSEEFLSKISGAGGVLSDEDKKTLMALATMFKQSGSSLAEVIEIFRKNYPTQWESFVGYIETIWETL